MITDPGEIWKRYRNYFCDDLLHRLRHTTVSFPLVLANPVYDYGLWLLAMGLADLQKGLADFFLPVNVFDWSDLDQLTIQRDEQAVCKQQAEEMERQLNDDQKECFRTITQAITDDPKNAHFYVQGPGGTGKTFLY
jgi:hypothetical protein